MRQPTLIPLFKPDLGDAEIRAVTDVIASGWVTAGPKVEEFEARFAAFVGSPHAVALNSCTAALHLASILLNIGPGDEVIVPSLTFVATANAVAATGATPVFADIKSSEDWTLSPEDVAHKITPRTKAVVVMHYAGYPCDMKALSAICADAGIALIEDAAHGLTGSLDGKHLGTIGQLGCYSFFSNKVMTTAEGGMLVTADGKLAERARRIRSHGQTSTAIHRMRGALNYDVSETGYNYRLDDIRAALGLAQMDRLETNYARRVELVARYRRLLEDVRGIRVPEHGKRGQAAHYIFPALIETADREETRRRLATAGVQTSHHYPASHLFSHYRRADVALPVTEDVVNRTVTLPLYPTMTDLEMDTVVSRLNEILNG
jgi:dTDP-4-amino-4,6-dideoxygalactose transaminase